jgi:two-component sensor histidine kinase
VSVSPLQDETGELRGIVSVSRDITERVAASELRNAAGAEMKHRLKNAYTLGGAIITTLARGSPHRQEFAGEVLERLQQLGLAQALLLEPAGQGTVRLPLLFSRLIEPFCNDGCAFSIGSLPDVALDEEDTRALALVLGELGTNSSKYGAIGRGGSVDVEGEIVDSSLLSRWRERSNEAVSREASATGGNGFRLINRALAARGGSMELSWTPNGPDVTLRLPLG